GYGGGRKNRGRIYLGQLSADHLRRTTVRRSKAERIGQRARRGGHRTLHRLEVRRDRNRDPIGDGWRRVKLGYKIEDGRSQSSITKQRCKIPMNLDLPEIYNATTTFVDDNIAQ